MSFCDLLGIFSYGCAKFWAGTSESPCFYLDPWTCISFVFGKLLLTNSFRSLPSFFVSLSLSLPVPIMHHAKIPRDMAFMKVVHIMILFPYRKNWLHRVHYTNQRRNYPSYSGTWIRNMKVIKVGML